MDVGTGAVLGGAYHLFWSPLAASIPDDFDTQTVMRVFITVHNGDAVDDPHLAPVVRAVAAHRAVTLKWSARMAIVVALAGVAGTGYAAVMREMEGSRQGAIAFGVLTIIFGGLGAGMFYVSTVLRKRAEAAEQAAIHRAGNGT